MHQAQPLLCLAPSSELASFGMANQPGTCQSTQHTMDRTSMHKQSCHNPLTQPGGRASHCMLCCVPTRPQAACRPSCGVSSCTVHHPACGVCSPRSTVCRLGYLCTSHGTASPRLHVPASGGVRSGTSQQSLPSNREGRCLQHSIHTRSTLRTRVQA